MNTQYQLHLITITLTGFISYVQVSSGFTPVLLLFLDCVRQLMEEYPSAFEFTETYLAALWESALSGLASEFAFDSIEQRRDAFRRSAFGGVLVEQALSMADELRSPATSSLASACGLRELEIGRGLTAAGDVAAAATPLDETYLLAAHLSCAFHLPTRYRFDDGRFRSELERVYCNALSTVFDANRCPYIEHLVQSSIVLSPIDSYLIDPSPPYCSTIPSQDDSELLCLSSPFAEEHHELLLASTSHPLRVRVWDELFCRWITQLWPVPSLQEPVNSQAMLIAQKFCQPSRQMIADFPEHAEAQQPHMQLFSFSRNAQITALLCEAIRLAPQTPKHLREILSQIDDPSPSQSEAVTPSPSCDRFTPAAPGLFPESVVARGNSISNSINTNATSPAHSSDSTLTPSPAHTPADEAVEIPQVPVTRQFLQKLPKPQVVGSRKSPPDVPPKSASKASVRASSASSASGVSTASALVRDCSARAATLITSDSPTERNPNSMTIGAKAACCNALAPRAVQQPPAAAHANVERMRLGSLVKQRVSEFTRQASSPFLPKTDADSYTSAAAAGSPAVGIGSSSSTSTQAISHRRAARNLRALVDSSAPTTPISKKPVIRTLTGPALGHPATTAAAASGIAIVGAPQQSPECCSSQEQPMEQADDGSESAHRDSPNVNKRPPPLPIPRSSSAAGAAAASTSISSESTNF